MIFRDFCSHSYIDLVLVLTNVHPRNIWTHDMEIGTGFPLTAKVMNNLVLIREKIKRAARLNEARLLATKNGEITPYNPSIFELRRKQARKDMKALNS